MGFVSKLLGRIFNPQAIATSSERWIPLGSALSTRSSSLTALPDSRDFVATSATPEPQSDGVSGGRWIHQPRSGSYTNIRVYGTGADNSTGKLRVWRWYPRQRRQTISGLTETVTQWSRELLIEASITLSADVDIANGVFGQAGNLVRYADTITIDKNRTINASASVSPSTPDDHRAVLHVDHEGEVLIECEVTRNGTAGTDATALGVEVSEVSAV